MAGTPFINGGAPLPCTAAAAMGNGLIGRQSCDHRLEGVHASPVPIMPNNLTINDKMDQ